MKNNNLVIAPNLNEYTLITSGNYKINDLIQINEKDSKYCLLSAASILIRKFKEIEENIIVYREKV